MKTILVHPGRLDRLQCAIDSALDCWEPMGGASELIEFAILADDKLTRLLGNRRGIWRGAGIVAVFPLQRVSHTRGRLSLAAWMEYRRRGWVLTDVEERPISFRLYRPDWRIRVTQAQADHIARAAARRDGYLLPGETS